MNNLGSTSFGLKRLNLYRAHKQGATLLLCMLFAVINFSSLFLNGLNAHNGHSDIIHTLSSLVSSPENHLSGDIFQIPSLSIQPFQQPNILFLVNDPSSPHVDKDVPFFDFMTVGLNYSVTYHEVIPPYSFDNYDVRIFL